MTKQIILYGIHSRRTPYIASAKQNEYDPYKELCEEFKYRLYQDYIYYMKLKYNLIRKPKNEKNKKYTSGLLGDWKQGVKDLINYVQDEDTNFSTFACNYYTRDQVLNYFKKIEKYYCEKYGKGVQ